MALRSKPEQEPVRSIAEDALTWIGGRDNRAGLEPRESSGEVPAGIVVLINTSLAWLAAAGALAGSPNVPIGAAIAVGLLFGLLVGVVSRAVAGRVPRTVGAFAGRVVGALVIGAIAGELASLVLFAGSIERRIDERAALAAQSVPAVIQASNDLEDAQASRADLDSAVEQARTRRDEALVVARCEYNPSADCPQPYITGVPGSGPETRTANGMLADAQQEFDAAVAVRADRAATLDAAVGTAERVLAGARAAAVADTDRGLGARWVAMNSLAMAGPGAVVLRCGLAAFFGFLTMLPLLLRLWRRDTAQDRVLAARTRCDVAELEAQAAIAITEAEVRVETARLLAEQQLAGARRAAAAGSVGVPGRQVEPVADGDSIAKAELEQSVERPSRGPLIPVLPDVTPLANAAARWITPLLPNIVARAIDTTKQPIRAARQAFEEVEEITFSLRRVHKVTLHSEEQAGDHPGVDRAPSQGEGRRWVDSATRSWAGATHPATAPSIGATTTRPHEQDSLAGPADRCDAELSAASGPRQLPPAE